MAFRSYDPDNLDNKERYKLLIGSVVPRPIAFVSTLSADGVSNLAPFSFFNAICSTPPIVAFSVAIRASDGGKKDTLRNIEATGEFVVHIVSEPIAQAMNTTAGEYPSDVDEFSVAGLTMLPSVCVKPFRVAESPIQMECKLHQLVHIGDTIGASTLVLGEVVAFHLSDDVCDEKLHIDIARLQPVARLAGNAYSRVTDIFELKRPS